MKQTGPWHSSSSYVTVRSLAAVGLVCLATSKARAEEAPAPLLSPPQAVESLPPQPTTPSSQGLTLADLEAKAMAGNPAMARAGALVSAARGNYLQVGLYPNPTVGYEGQQLGSGGLAEQHGVVFGQDIVTGGKLRLNREVATQQIRIAEQEYAKVELRVLTDVRKTYYQVLIAQRQSELANDLIALSQEVTRAVDLLHRAKEVGRGDILQASLERQQAEILLEASQQRLQAAWRELAAIIGDPTLKMQPLAGDPTATSLDLKFDEVLLRLQSQSPELAAAAAQLQRARLSLERERVQPIPNLTLQGTVNWIDNGIGGKPDGGVLLSVPVPIFDRNQGAIMRAEREMVAARQAITQLELDLQQRLAPIYENYANARQQATRYREAILPQAAESLKLSREMYQAGELNYTALLTVQRTFAFANRDYLETILRLRTAEAEIEGLLLSGSLSKSPAE